MRIFLKQFQFVFISLLINVLFLSNSSYAASGMDWLVSSQNADGSYVTTADIATATQATSEVINTYWMLGETSHPGIPAAIDYVNSETYLNTEHLSRIIVINASNGNDVSAYITQLQTYQNIDGGFGDLPGYHSTSIDTAFALNAFSAAPQSTPEIIDGAILYILNQQNSDGSFTLSDRNDSSIYITSICVSSLRQYLFQYSISTELDKALSFIIDSQAINGGWGKQWETALALNAIVPLTTDKSSYLLSADLLKGDQLANGSWGNDAYITALAVRAIHLVDNISDPVDPTNGSIAGRVVNLSTGEPIAGVSVSLEQEPFTTTQTAANGSFSIINIPVNSYTVEYAASGFTGVSQALTTQTGVLIDVGTVSLVPLSDVGIIKGMVSASVDGSAIAGALVSVTGSFSASTSTDAAGNYEIAGAAGNVVITVSATSYEPAIASGLLNASSILSFSPALLDAGTTTTGPEVTVTGVIISGESGQPVQGANISVVSSTESAITGSDGVFEITGLQSGELTISVVHADYLQQQLSLVAPEGATINLGMIRLYQQAPTVSSISGVVTDSITGAPVSGVEMQLVGTNNITTTSLAGEYAFTDLVGNEFTVNADATGYFSSTSGISVAQPTNVELNFTLNRAASTDFDITNMQTKTGIYVYSAGASVEADVLMFNSGASDKLVRVFYKVVSSVGEIIEEGPVVLIPLNSDPSIAYVNVPAGQEVETTVEWNTLSHAPDDYQIIAQIYDVQTGQLLAERGLGVTVQPTSQISGRSDFDPPIAQLASNTPINITAAIVNSGNQVIEPTTMTAILKLVNEGNRPRQDLVTISNTLTDASFSQTRGMDIDAGGNIFVANKLGGTVSIIRSDETISVFADNLTNPVDVDLSVTGDTYILQQDLSYIVIDENGNRTEVTTNILNQTGIEAITGGDVLITSDNALYSVTSTAVVTKIVSGGIADPHDMVVATDGTVYIASGGDGSVTQYKDGGLSTFVEGINQPYGLALDTNDDLIVTSFGDNTLLRITPQGVITVITAGLSGPFDVILDSAGNYVVSNMMSNEIIQVDRGGQKTVIGEATTNRPFSAVYNASGELFVGNAGSSNIIKYDQTGVASEFANGLINPIVLLTAADGGLDVLEGGGSIYHVLPDGNKTKIVDGRANTTGFVKAPDGNGYITVESSKNVLARVDATGQFSNYLERELNFVSFMIRSSSGNIYAYGSGNTSGALYRITPDYQIEVVASGFGAIFGIAVDASENVYMTDFSRREILKVDNSGNVTVEASPSFNPGAITINGQGDVLLAQYNSTTIYQLAAGGVLNEIAQLTDPITSGFLQDANGDIWTVNASAGAVTRTSSTGVVDVFPGLTSPGTIVLDGVGGVFVSARGGIKHVSDTGAITDVASHSKLSRTNVSTFAIDANDDFFMPGPSSVYYLIDKNSNLVNRYTPIKTPTEIIDDGNGVLYLANSNGIVRVRGEGYMPEIVALGGFRSIARETATTAIVSGGGAPQKLDLVTGALGTFLPYSSTTLSFVESIAVNPSGGFVLADSSNRLIYYANNDTMSDIQVGIVSPRGIMFDQAGKLLIANDVPKGIMSVRNDKRAEAYINDSFGFDYLQPTANGTFYATSRRNGQIHEYDTLSRRIATLTVPESEAVAITSDGTVYSTVPSLAALISISTDGSSAYEQLASGLSKAEDVEADFAGKIFVSDSSRNTILSLNSDKTLSLEYTDVFNAQWLSFGPNGKMFVTNGPDFLTSFDVSGEIVNLSLRFLVPDQGQFGGLVINDEGALYVSTVGENTVLKLNAINAEPVTLVGDIVFSSTVDITQLPLSENAIDISFGSWSPRQSGDYMLEVVVNDGVTESRLNNTIHIGAQSNGTILLSDKIVPTGDQSVSGVLQVTGVDSTKLSRIDPDSLTLAVSTFTNTAGTALAADSIGNIYVSDVTSLLKITPDGTVNTFVNGISSGVSQLAVDSDNIIYAQSYTNDILKITPDGSVSVLATLSGQSRGVALDSQEELYAVDGAGALVHINKVDGAVTPLPATGLVDPRGFTIDAYGNFYIISDEPNPFSASSNNSIIKVTPEGVSSTYLADIGFEHEGLTMTADCSNNLLLAPIHLPPYKVGGEENLILQLIGNTGEIGVVLNGPQANSAMGDMDMLYFDRFGHRLLIWTDKSGGKVFSIPVVCGGIDTSTHIVTRSDVDLSSANPAPSSIIDLSDGSKEYIWQLSDVNDQAQNIQLNMLFKGLSEGESRDVFQQAYMQFNNSFNPTEPVRVAIDIPGVTVSSQLVVSTVVDAAQYQPDSLVNISSDIINGGNNLFNGTLTVSIIDAEGSVVERLTDVVIDNLASQAAESYSNIWSTGSTLTGDYTVVSNLLDATDQIIASNESAFRIISNETGSAVVTASVSTNKPSYEAWDQVEVNARVRNISGNAIQLPGNVSITVIQPDGTVLFSNTQTMRELYPNSYQDLTENINLIEADSGQYTITMNVTAASGELLTASTVNFDVVSTPTQALTGSVTAIPASVNAGEAVVCSSQIVNIASSSINNILVTQQAANTATAQIITEEQSTEAITANGSLATAHTINTTTLAQGEYVCLLTATVAGEVQPLAAAGFQVLQALLPPVANAGPDLTTTRDLPVTLDGSGSSSPEGKALVYQWRVVTAPVGSIAMLNNSALVNPTIIVDKRGSYALELTVSDGALSSEPDTVIISVVNTPPVSNAGPDQSVLIGQAVMLDATASTDYEGDALSYQWSIISKPAESTSTLSGTSDAMPDLVIDSHGTYELQLVVNDGFDNSAADTVILNVGNVKPIAQAGLDQAALIGQTITLDGSASTDDDGDALTYRWELVSQPADSTAQLSSSNNVITTFVVDGLGTYQLQLIVNDGFEDSEPGIVLVDVVNVKPVANAGPDMSVFVNGVVTLDGSASVDADGDTLTYQWSLLSRPTGSTTTLVNDTSVSPELSIDKGGMYIVQLIVDDGIEESEPDTVVLNVINVRPVANAGADQTVTKGSNVILNGSGYDADGDGLTYQWSLLNQPTGSQAVLTDPNTPMPQFVTDQVGAYIAQLIADDGQLASEPDTITVTAVNQPPVCEQANAEPNALWPPNGKFIAIALQGITDADGDVLTLNITGISQDEPVDSTGDGSTGPDAIIDGDQPQVRSERSGGGNGRVYHISFIADDGIDQCSGKVTVSVPHDKNDSAIDDGQNYDATR